MTVLINDRAELQQVVRDAYNDANVKLNFNPEIDRVIGQKEKVAEAVVSRFIRRMKHAYD